MRGITNVLNYWRHASKSKLLVTGLSAIALVMVGTFLVYQQPAEQAGAASKCNGYKIVKCGVKGKGEINQKYRSNYKGDVRTVYNRFGFNQNEMSKAKAGYIDKSNKIKVNGRVVATGAWTVYRPNKAGGGPAADDPAMRIGNRTYHKQNINETLSYYGMKKMKVWVVLDKDGKFKYGILENCGNPVTGKPTPPPKVKACDAKTNRIVTIKKSQLSSKRYVGKNSNKCKKTKACDVRTDKIVTITRDKLSSKRYTKNMDNCRKVRVCDTNTNKIVTVTKQQAKQNRYVNKNSNQCKKVRACDVKTGKIVTITRNQLKSKRYTLNMDNCKNVKVCDTKTGEIVTVTKQQAKNSRYANVNSKQCKDEPDVPSPMVKVCDTTTGEIVRVTKVDAKDDRYAPVNSEECQPEVEVKEVQVCDTETGEIVTVTEEEAADERYADMDAGECQPKEETPIAPEVPEEPETPAPAPEEEPAPMEVPEEVPATGPAAALAGLIGTGAMAGGAASYLRSRRNLNDVFKG